MELPGGLTLRTAQSADLEQVCALLAERGDPADAEDLLLVVDDPDEGLDAVMVVVDGDRVVSTATLLQETVVIGGVATPAGQVEMVATDPAYEQRGLVRALMDEAHRRSAERGDLLQVMIGIPFFYRQFGYVYSMPIPLTRELHTPPAADPSISVRRATLDDIPAMVALQDAAQSSADVRMPHSAGCWRWVVQRSGSHQLVAVRNGDIVATARATPPEEGVAIGEIAGDAAGIAAIVAAQSVHGDVTLLERPGTALDAIADADAHPPELPDRTREWFYSRVVSPAPLLDHLRPALLQRFRDSGIGGRHEVLLSSWRSHVRFTIDDDGMSTVVPGGPEQAPGVKGGAGVPPDLMAPLLLGPFGAAGLEARHGDVRLSRIRELMEILFPPMRSDLLTFYLAY
jgi:predicted N-acetyltransferase YhbS